MSCFNVIFNRIFRFFVVGAQQAEESPSTQVMRRHGQIRGTGDEKLATINEFDAKNVARVAPMKSMFKKKRNQHNCGELNFRMEYDFEKKRLVVTVIEAKALTAKDRGGTSDPYIKVYLEPDKKKKYETKIRRKTLNPVYNETFHFDVPYSELPSRNLMMVIYDFDRMSKDDRIGQLRVPLCEVDLGDTVQEWRDLQPPEVEEELSTRLGDVCFSMRYRDTTGTLTVTILEARNLKKMDVAGLSDPYIKITVMQGTKRLFKKKTTVKKNTLNPYYNESFQFKIPANLIHLVRITISAWDYDKVGANDQIGVVMLGSQSHPSISALAAKHWQEMMETKRPVVYWHTLQEPLAEK